MKLTEYLPERLLSPPVENFEEAIQPAMDGLNEALLGITEKELFAGSAEHWLPLWEAAYGLAIDPEKPTTERQARLMSKMRSAGATTAELLRQTVSSFANADCEVIEHSGEYRFTVKFTGIYGIPPNMDDVRAALEELKPAHLAYGFLFLYRTWQEFADKAWGELEAFTWEELEVMN